MRNTLLKDKGNEESKGNLFFQKSEKKDEKAPVARKGTAKFGNAFAPK